MLVVVCYDISEDATRTRMANCLLNFGVRIQESVFEAVLEKGHFERLIGAVERITLGESDRVRVYRVCARCVNEITIIGFGEVTRDPDFYLV